MQIPEHTWGFDTKTFLHDNANWSNAQFHAQLAGHADNYEANIAQWQRQKGYMSWALEALGMAAAPSQGTTSPAFTLPTIAHMIKPAACFVTGMVNACIV